MNLVSLACIQVNCYFDGVFSNHYHTKPPVLRQRDKHKPVFKTIFACALDLRRVAIEDHSDRYETIL